MKAKEYSPTERGHSLFMKTENWIKQLSPEVEKCSRCKKPIPKFALHFINADNEDVVTKSHCRLCLDCVIEFGVFEKA